jgi:hypothetical protein
MIRKVYQRLWNEDRTFVAARSTALSRKIGKLLLRAEPPYRRIFRHLHTAALMPEGELGPALTLAWIHMARRASPAERAEVLLAIARDPSAARLRLHSLARKYGEPSLLASRLFMHPSQANKVWIAGRRGWALYCVYGRKVTKRPLRFIAYQLASLTTLTGDAYRFGGALRLLDRRPYSYFDLTRELGQHWHHACREMVRRLLIYPLNGKYYANARMIPLFREIYDDAVGRGVSIRARQWSEGKCEIIYSDGLSYKIRLADLVGGLYDLAGAMAGKDAYGIRGMLRYLKGAETFTENRLRLESGRGSIRYPLQKFQDQGLVVPEGPERYRVAVSLEPPVRFYEKILRLPSRPILRRGKTPGGPELLRQPHPPS